MSAPTGVDPGSPTGVDAAQEETPTPRRRRRRRRIILITLLAVLVPLGGIMLTAGIYLASVDNSVGRVDAFSDVPAQSRPSPDAEAKGAQNLLILGSDSRDPQNTTGSRSDTIILAHLPKDRSSAELISIPRDTWLSIPKSHDGKHGGVNAKINAAFAWGGVPLMVQTVETYTNVRIDHVVLVDFAGFKEIIDALGGVDIYVDQSFTSTHSLNPDGKRHFDKGLTHMDGAAALDYSRERYTFADGDFTRIRHQQQMIKAVLDKAASAGLLANPARLNSVVRATANAATVDKTLSLFDMAMSLRHLRGGDLKFATNPSTGTGRVGGESVVFADTAKDRTLYQAIRRDDVSGILNAIK